MVNIGARGGRGKTKSGKKQRGKRKSKRDAKKRRDESRRSGGKLGPLNVDHKLVFLIILFVVKLQ